MLTLNFKKTIKMGQYKFRDRLSTQAPIFNNLTKLSFPNPAENSHEKLASNF